LLNYFLAIFYSFSLSAIVFQDFKYRHIRLINIIVLLLTSVIWVSVILSPAIAIENVLYNFIFLFSQWFCVSLFYSIKHSKWVNINDTMIGWGDWLFLLSIAPLFNIVVFVLFYISSFIISLLSFLIYSKLINKNYNQTVPLAGIVALCCILLFFILDLSPLNSFNTIHTIFSFER
jgi:hypothetical protein